MCRAGAIHSPLAIGEWITEAPAHVLEQGGVRPDPLLPQGPARGDHGPPTTGPHRW
ncbi:hypothetical protein ACFZBM_17000 [Streptomyces lavendulae]|uniref:hypothetical protein n=1 Tax=Streptomyces lavendulae TaxID=1914 RepID=UPI001F2D89A4|nr:hypothetical protein [Streptomyces lavendulae]